MNEQTIRKYAALMKELGLTGIEIDEERGYFRLECDQPTIIRSGDGAPAAAVPVVRPEAAPVATNLSYKTTSFKSPMVGVFYAAPTEEDEPFVKVGDQVHKGDTLCIIESMKLMNEVPSDVDGTVTQILVDNAQPVEYGQPILVIE